MQGYRFISDTLGGNGGVPLPSAVATGDRFSWGDAGIGALAASGAMLVLFGGGPVVLRRRAGNFAV